MKNPNGNINLSREVPFTGEEAEELRSKLTMVGRMIVGRMMVGRMMVGRPALFQQC